MDEKIIVTTWRGHEIDLMTGPRHDQVEIEDIAHAMAYQCRFNGHINRYYSDAEHSVYVSAYSLKMTAIYYLLHDAEGYIMGDIITPVKKMIWGADYKSNKQYQVILKRIKKPIIESFGLKYEAYLNLENHIKEVDNRVYDLESKFLRGEKCPAVPPIIGDDPIDGAVFGLTHEQAEKLFLNRFHELMA